MNSPDHALAPVWQNQFALLLESTGEGIFGIDLGGHCTFINQAGARMLGLEVAQVLGLNMHELTHHSHADGSVYPAHDCPIFNAFRQGLPCRIDTEVFWNQAHVPPAASCVPAVARCVTGTRCWRIEPRRANCRSVRPRCAGVSTICMPMPHCGKRLRQPARRNPLPSLVPV